jgi:hypothetical protein
MTFAYHRSLAPMLWVFVALAGAELVIVHLLLVLWKPWLAWTLSVLSLATIAWIVGIILSFRSRPVCIADGVLVMRAGALKSIAVPLDRVAGLRDGWSAADLKRPDTLNLALLAWPNVFVELTEPLARGRRAIHAIAHKLDDPTAFAAALDGLGRADG